MTDPVKTHYRACNLCEAICGLEIRTQGARVLSIRGDKNDPISRGFICPKATALADIQSDPDRVRTPVRKVDGQWQPMAWDDALDLAAESIVTVQQRHGQHAVGFYAGNPSVHNWGNLTHGIALRKAVGSQANFSATSLDQLPHHLAGLLMYGHQFFVPIPDIDRTELFVIFGGNPLASNGSMMTMANARGKFKDLQARGGRLLVFDPRRTETAAVADEHHFIKPGTDAYLLVALIQQLFEQQLLRIDIPAEHLKGLDRVAAAVEPFTPELAEARCGVPAPVIRQLARDLSETDRAVIYGRMGVSVQRFGSLCQWAVQVINILIGAFDREGGALLTTPALDPVQPGARGAGRFDRFRSRVRGLPEFGGELPAVTLAEEILTEGEGQIRGLVTIAGNPLRSSAGSHQLTEAIRSLEFQLAIDIYINETTSHADLILPTTTPLEHDHYDIAFLKLAVRDHARYNPPVFDPPEGVLHDWEIFNSLAERICALHGREFQPLPAPDVLLGMGLGQGPYNPERSPDDAVTLERLKDSPHGIDLGPLKPGAVQRLCTEDQKIDLLPDLYLQELQRLGADRFQTDDLLLIGRRHLRCNNSWLHNSHRLTKGKPRWQLLMHPDDLRRRGLNDGDAVTVQSRAGSVTTVVAASEDMMSGVVSLPHGWGHDEPGAKLSIAGQQKGANCNALTDDQWIDAASGNAALNGVPVKVTAA
ncbi:MAG: molybdopterin-dependent oxidoreductase [Xanthomonadales bacterium]|nr:molybdopterin-dependent oxidoreductase [Xanthomonadales bacterium]